MLTDVADDFGVFAHGFCPCHGGVEVTTVRTGHVGDVPDGVGTGTVLQRGTSHGIGELLHRLGAVSQRVVGCGSPVVVGFVPHGRVECHVGSLLRILCLHVLGADGVQQSCSVDADGRFEAHLIVRRLRIGVEGCDGDVDLRIDEGELLAVGELQGDAAGHHALHILPLDGDLVLVDGSLEWFHCLGLRHTRHLADVRGGSCGVAHAVFRECLVGMIDHEQIAVADGVGTIFRLAFAMTIGGVAMEAAAAHPGWTQSLAGFVGVGVEMFEEILTLVETHFQSHGFRTRSHRRVTGFLRGAQFAARIPFGSGEHIVAHAKWVFFFLQFAQTARVVLVATCREGKRASQQQKEAFC